MASLTFLLIAIVVLWWTFRLANKAQPAKNELLENRVRCPSCKAPLEIEEMLDAAVFFGGSAIIFDCGHCHDRVYFAPYENHIETGTLSCSPVVDPIPHEKFSYSSDFEMTSNVQDGVLKIEIKKRSWKIRKYGL